MLAPAIIGFLIAALVLALGDISIFHLLRPEAMHFDQTVRASVHSETSPSLTHACEIITNLGTWPVLPMLALFLFIVVWRRGRRDLAWFPLAALGVSTLVMEVSKDLVRRTRPQAWFGLHTPASWSFPSGHSLNSTVCYLVFAATLFTLCNSRLSRVIIVVSAIVLPLTIGFTRIYLGVHWPTDVLAGWVAGFCLAAGLIGSHRRMARRMRS